jgi:hypothetical protein
MRIFSVSDWNLMLSFLEVIFMLEKKIMRSEFFVVLLQMVFLLWSGFLR